MPSALQDVVPNAYMLITQVRTCFDYMFSYSTPRKKRGLMLAHTTLSLLANGGQAAPAHLLSRIRQFVRASGARSNAKNFEMLNMLLVL